MVAVDGELTTKLVPLALKLKLVVDVKVAEYEPQVVCVGSLLQIVDIFGPRMLTETEFGKNTRFLGSQLYKYIVRTVNCVEIWSVIFILNMNVP